MMQSKQIEDLFETLEERYGEHHKTCKHLRRFWEGRMWEDEAAMTRSLVSVFRDLRHGGAEADREPDVRVTLPLIESVVAKWMGFLTGPPQISMLTPPIGYKGLRKEETCRALADQNEKFLYGLWEQSRVRIHFAKQAWYLPLMGSSFTGVHPDFDAKTVRFLTRSPEHAYPVWDSELEHMTGIGFKWDVPADQIERQYGPDVMSFVDVGRGNSFLGRFGARNNNQKPILQVAEWWDMDSKTTMVAGHVVSQVQHNLGFVPWVMTPFYRVPDEPFGKGVVEGNVSLFQKMNMLDSLELQAIIENIFATMVIEGPQGAPEDIERGPGAVIPVQLGGKVYYISAPPETTNLTTALARSMDFAQRGTHLPGSAYGEGVATSITTGKAQHESMMPTGNMVDYIQGNIGDSWERLNEYAIDMTQSVFKNRKVVYFGRQYTQKGWAASLERPERFMLTIKGADLQDWARHELTFQPMLNMHEKVVMLLQELGGGLVSKRFIRDNIGIVDNQGMEEEILEEQLREQKLAALLGMAQQGAISPDQIESWFVAMEKGGTTATDPTALAGAMPMPPPGAPPGAPPGMPMPPMPPPGGGGAPPPPAAGAQTLPAALNPGESAPPAGIQAPPQPAPEGQFTLDGAVGDFSKLKKIKGRIFLVGEIVQKGATDGPVEVDVTNPIDKQTILNGLPDVYHGAIKFHTVPGEPQEQHVEVGPGKTDAQHGGGPLADHPNAVTAGDQQAIEFSDMPVSPGGLRNPPLAANYPQGGFQGALRS